MCMRSTYGVRMGTAPIGSRVVLNYDLTPAEWGSGSVTMRFLVENYPKKVIPTFWRGRPCLVVTSVTKLKDVRKLRISKETVRPYLTIVIRHVRFTDYGVGLLRYTLHTRTTRRPRAEEIASTRGVEQKHALLCSTAKIATMPPTPHPSITHLTMSIAVQIVTTAPPISRSNHRPKAWGEHPTIVTNERRVS